MTKRITKTKAKQQYRVWGGTISAYGEPVIYEYVVPEGPRVDNCIIVLDKVTADWLKETYPGYYV